MNAYTEDWKRISAERVREVGKCQHCGHPGKPGYPLGVHHKNRDKADNRPDNLVVLCPRCHARIEWRLWRGMESGEQLVLEF